MAKFQIKSRVQTFKDNIRLFVVMGGVVGAIVVASTFYEEPGNCISRKSSNGEWYQMLVDAETNRYLGSCKG